MNNFNVSSLNMDSVNQSLRGISASFQPFAKRTGRLIQEKLGNAEEIVRMEIHGLECCSLHILFLFIIYLSLLCFAVGNIKLLTALSIALSVLAIDKIRS